MISVRFWVYNASSTLICSADVRDAILFYHPDAATDDRLFRWTAMQFMQHWIDHETRRPMAFRPDEPERGTGPVRTTQEEQNPGKNAPKQPGEKCKNATPKKKAQTDAETGATPNERGKSQKQATPPLYNWRDSEKEISTERGQNGVESDQTPILDPEITADRDAPSVISVRFWVYNAPSTLICSADVRDAILFYHPDAATDDRLFRWIVMQGMHPWIDHETRRPLAFRPDVRRDGRKRFANESATWLIEYILATHRPAAAHQPQYNRHHRKSPDSEGNPNRGRNSHLMQPNLS